MRRRVLAAQIVVLLLPAIALSTHPALTEAADGGLVVLAQARYVVQPSDHRVHVTVDAVATSFEPDTPEGRVYYSGVTFAVQPGATNVAAFSAGQPIGARIAKQTDDFTSIEVTFGRGVFYQQSYPYVVSFDLVDPGGAGTRDLRIGESLAAFPVWAFGTAGEPGSSVSVELPEGYTASLQGNAMRTSRLPGGGTQLRAEPQDPLGFFVYVTADRPGAFSNRSVQVDVNGISTEVLVRTWEDDPDWGRRVTRLLRRGLPALQALIGVDYPGREPRRLTVEEAATSRLGEYAGIFDPVTSVIRVRYDADAFVAMHEAAHIWFNDSLFHDRWINEAWAEYYGVEAGRALGASGQIFELTDELLDVRIPLNDWGAIGVESLHVEDFAYAATYSLARDIVRRTDVEHLQLVWQAADAGDLPYQPATGADEDAASFQVEGWKLLLDLLEERTGTGYADLWRRWVVNDRQQRLLAARQSARHHYDEVTAAADDWDLPEPIRLAMSTWDFDEADRGLDVAAVILDHRDEIRAAAAALDLTAPPTLKAAFESDDGLDAAAAQATAELATLDQLANGTAALGDEPELVEAIGLIGSDPSVALAEARSAFEEGDLAAADRAAGAATTLRQGAAGEGRIRVLAGGAAVLLVDGGVMAIGFAHRRRRQTAAA